MTRTLTCDLFITVDGYALGDGAAAYFGYPGPDLDRWISEQLAFPQTLVMGRVTYQAMAAAATSSGSGCGDADTARMTELPKVVVSSTLSEPLVWPNTTLLHGDAASLIRTLKHSRGDPLRTIGSLSLVSHFLRHGLVDRLRLMVFPVILGRTGREPVLREVPDVRLELVGSQLLDDRLVCLEYAPIH
jgi:dihydrofolate reductase